MYSYHFTYNDLGQTENTSYYESVGGETPSSYVKYVRFSYDPAGRPVRETSDDGDMNNIGYDIMGRVVAARNNNSEIQYDTITIMRRFTD